MGRLQGIHLFPAYAGVIPEPIDIQGEIETFPRLRGGDPRMNKRYEEGRNFSPPTRG